MTWRISNAGLPRQNWQNFTYGIFHSEVLYATVDSTDFPEGKFYLPWQQAYLFCRDLIRRLNNQAALPPMLDRRQIKVYDGVKQNLEPKPTPTFNKDSFK